MIVHNPQNKREKEKVVMDGHGKERFGHHPHSHGLNLSYHEIFLNGFEFL
jgi:hypothetical protein